jgi:hypothetical protein
MVGAGVSWTNDITNNCYYSTAYNIYIYPVNNVAEYDITEYDILTLTTNNINS